MKLPKKPKKWNEMSDEEQRAYVKKKIDEYQGKLDFMNKVSRKLSSNRNVTEKEIELIDLVLEKESPS